MPADTDSMEPSREPLSPKTDPAVAGLSELPKSEQAKSDQASLADTTIDVAAVTDVKAVTDASGEKTPEPTMGASSPVAEIPTQGDPSQGGPSQEKPSERLQIGSQRASDSPPPAVATPDTSAVASGDVSSSAASVDVSDPATRRKNYPPPNTRDQLSPELEKELESALGDQSIDSLIEESTSTESTVGELAPETQVTAQVVKIHREDVFVDLGGRTQGILPLKQFTGKSGGAGTGHSSVGVAAPDGSGTAGSGTLGSTPQEDTDPSRKATDSRKAAGKSKSERGRSSEGKGASKEEEPSADPPPATGPEIGSRIEVIVTRYNAEQGLYEVSLPNVAVAVGNWDDVQEGQIVEVTITSTNKGGLECQIAGLRGFMPMGQISIYRVENVEQYVGQRMACVVTEANRDRRNLVVSHRAVMERERHEQRKKLLAELAPGQIREGTVRSLQDFGAFVDLGGIDGLIHISQLSWDHIGHPREVLETGQKLQVRVEKVDQEKGKIGLAYRDLGENPWTNVPTKYSVGSCVRGTVTKLMQFGAFVKLEPGVEGLIHISELGHGRVHRTGDVVSEGQEVEIKVLSVDPDAQRIGLSLKAMLPPPEKPKKEKQNREKDEADARAKEQKSRRKPDKHLKGGIGGPSGGEQFGLKW